MISYLRSTNYRPVLKEKETLQPGSWVRCEKPNEDELKQLKTWGLDTEILVDTLDPHEIPRVELDSGWTYFITRLPGADDNFNDFTAPILFALGGEYLVTVSRDSLGRFWQPFIDKNNAPTTQQTKLFLIMIDAIAKQYQTRVASINRQMRAATSDVTNLHSKDIGAIVQYERKLNDYLDALIPTNTALENLLGGGLLRLYEDDKDLVEGLSIDVEQLIARCKSLLRTITNVRDSYRAVMDTRLNETIRLLTVITLSLTIPTMLAGLFGMNVAIPGGDYPYTFWIIVTISLVFGVGFGYYFLKKR
ncbi:MAG TPA: magnesium transporter CorA family protein [Candidatus Saccharimonadales bacterium]|nr:magnesium transporter CorA family protein [Candidatus Saccharimonadales bacterium]